MAGRPKKYQTEEERIAARKLNEQKRREGLKEQLKTYGKQYREANKESLKAKQRKYYSIHKEKRIAYSKQWSKSNPERRRQTQRIGEQRRKQNSLYKFYSNIRSNISYSFKRNKKNLNKTLKTEEILGCSLDEFRDYILSLAPEAVKLNDFGKFGYHIDHIIPIDKAKTEEDVIKLCHYKNLQPLWWKDNLQKSNKIVSKNE